MEAGALHCPSCGAAIAADALQCGYCHSPLATVACPKCLSLVGQHASHCSRCGTLLEAAVSVATTSACPDCHTPLSAAQIGGVDLEQCPGCAGVWVTQPVFEQIAAVAAQRGQVLGALPATPKIPAPMETVRYRPCPVCGQLMNRFNYGHISGVVLDVCKQHGLWFDRDELRQVLTFIESGGLEKDRARELQKLDEQRRMAAQTPLSTGGGAWSDTPLFSPRGTALASVVESLAALFNR
jgi:Zn-finger nucleic acid-binding protein